MVRKRDDGRWEGRIVIGHKENGEPLFRHVYAKTQKALLDKLHQNIESYRDVELTEDSRMTLGEWIDRWLTEYKASTVRPGTLENYRRYIDLYIKPQLGGKQVSLVSQQDIQRMYRRLKTDGRIREHPELDHQLSDGRRRQRLFILMSFQDNPSFPIFPMRKWLLFIIAQPFWKRENKLLRILPCHLVNFRIYFCRIPSFFLGLGV